MDLGISLISIVEERAKDIRDKSDVVCNLYQSAEYFPDHRELSSVKKYLMVFDDLLLEKQNTCETYYVRGININVDCFYLPQNYFKLPRQTIKENANFMSVFLYLKILNQIFDDHVGSDMTKEKEFRQVFKTDWENQHGFVIIDLNSKKPNGKYRSGLDEFCIPN